MEALEDRRLLAANVFIPDAPAYGGTGIVSQFETSVVVSDPETNETQEAPEYTAAFDIDGDGIADETVTGQLPLEATFVPLTTGPQQVSMTLSGPAGDNVVSGEIDVVPFAVKDGVLKLGGTETNDEAILEVLSDGSLQATVNGTAEVFHGAGSIAIRLGAGDDTLTVGGAFVLNLAEAQGADIQGVETLRLDPQSDIQLVNVTAAAVEAAGGRLTIESAPHHFVQFSSDWTHAGTVIEEGAVSHVLRAGEQALNFRDGVLRNPLLHEDTNLDGTVTSHDALAVINELNRRGSGTEAVVDPSPSRLTDVNGDGGTTARDALLIINWLNRNQRRDASGEGEATLMVPPLVSFASTKPRLILCSNTLPARLADQ